MNKKKKKGKTARNKIKNHSHKHYGSTLQVLDTEELHQYHEPEMKNKNKRKHYRLSVHMIVMILHTRGESNVVQVHYISFSPRAKSINGRIRGIRKKGESLQVVK